MGQTDRDAWEWLFNVGRLIAHLKGDMVLLEFIERVLGEVLDGEEPNELAD